MTDATALPDTARSAPLALWRAMGAFLAMLFNLIGAPERIANLGVLTRPERQLMLSWLRAGEAMLRRLLLIEAKALRLAPPKPSIARVRKQRVRHPHAFSPDGPEFWRVSFRCAGPMQHQRPAGQRRSVASNTSARVYNAWPIAERLEAMLRVHNDPTARVRSLARWLQRHPERETHLLEAPEDAPTLFGRESFDRAGELAAETPKPPDSG